MDNDAGYLYSPEEVTEPASAKPPLDIEDAPLEPGSVPADQVAAVVTLYSGGRPVFTDVPPDAPDLPNLLGVAFATSVASPSCLYPGGCFVGDHQPGALVNPHDHSMNESLLALALVEEQKTKESLHADQGLLLDDEVLNRVEPFNVGLHGFGSVLALAQEDLLEEPSPSSLQSDRAVNESQITDTYDEATLMVLFYPLMMC